MGMVVTVVSKLFPWTGGEELGHHTPERSLPAAWRSPVFHPRKNRYEDSGNSGCRLSCKNRVVTAAPAVRRLSFIGRRRLCFGLSSWTSNCENEMAWRYCGALYNGIASVA